jgi:hypothetical protein
MSKENQHQEEVELTAEELAERKADMLKFYTESIPYLTAQLEYEKVLCDIDEARFKRTSINYQLAMMMNPPTEGEDDLDAPKPEQERKLKTQ